MVEDCEFVETFKLGSATFIVIFVCHRTSSCQFFAAVVSVHMYVRI